MPRESSAWPECYNSFQKLQGQCSTGVKSKESTPLKSCLKSESRSNSLARTSNTRSKSPSTRESPAKQNVNFKQETISKKFQIENGTSTQDQPYETINVKISQCEDETQKFKTPPPMPTKLSDSKNMRMVPIVRDVRTVRDESDNPVTKEAKYEPTNSARIVPIQIQKNNKINLNPFLPENDCHIDKKQEARKVQSGNTEVPLATEDACYACDACTQTGEKEKKDGCHVM